jgi:hypothetical protein
VTTYSYDSEGTRLGRWLKAQGPAFWTGVFGVVLLLFAWGFPVGYAEQPDVTTNFDEPEITITWGSVTIWVLRGATIVGLLALVARQLRSSAALGVLIALAGVTAAVTAYIALHAVDVAVGEDFRYITSSGLWFAVGGGVSLLIAAVALARTARRPL